MRFRELPCSFPRLFVLFSLAGSCLGGVGGGGGVVHPWVPSFMGFLFRWQCSSLASERSVPSVTVLIFLALVVPLLSLGQSAFFSFLGLLLCALAPFLGRCGLRLLLFPWRFVSEIPLLPSVPLIGDPIPVWGVLAPITRCLDASSSGSSLLFLGLGLLICCSVF